MYNLKNEDMRWNDYIGEMIIWAMLVCIVWWVLLLSGCTTTKVVPEYHREYIVRTDTFAKMDSVYVHDSVYTYHTGDTVFINKVRYKDRIRNVYKVRTDTLIKTDSIRVPYPIEKQLTKSEKRYITLGKYAAGSLVAVVTIIICCLVWWIWRKLR